MNHRIIALTHVSYLYSMENKKGLKKTGTNILDPVFYFCVNIVTSQD